MCVVVIIGYINFPKGLKNQSALYENSCLHVKAALSHPHPIFIRPQQIKMTEHSHKYCALAFKVNLLTWIRSTSVILFSFKF